jgi:hypothetical protein
MNKRTFVCLGAILLLCGFLTASRAIAALCFNCPTDPKCATLSGCVWFAGGCTGTSTIGSGTPAFFCQSVSAGCKAVCAQYPTGTKEPNGTAGNSWVCSNTYTCVPTFIGTSCTEGGFVSSVMGFNTYCL